MVAFFAFFVAIGFSRNNTFAIEEAVSAEETIHIGISPYEENLDLKAGEAYNGELFIFNSGENSIEYKMVILPYQVKNEEYDPDYTTVSDRTMIVDWISIENGEGILKPGERKSISYHVVVPEDVQTGGQNAVLLASGTAVKQNESIIGSMNVSINAALNIYANIQGADQPLTNEGSVISNTIPGIVINGPLTVSSEVENTGNSHEDAYYSMEVYSLLSSNKVFSLSGPELVKVILPNTKRLFSMKWDQTPSIGLFRIRQRVVINDQISEAEKVVVICPLWLILVLSAGIVLLTILIIIKIEKQYNAIKRQKNKTLQKHKQNIE